MLKTAEMGIHHIQRHLDGVEFEVVLRCSVEHSKVHYRILMPCEADVANLAGLLCVQHRLHCPAGSKDSIRVLKTNNLMKLHQVHVVGLQATQRFVNLSCCRFLCTSVDFGHQEGLLPIAVTERFAHANLAATVVLIQAVVL